MMIFHITAIDKDRKTRQFSYGLNDLGASLDFIHELVARGDSLVSVQVRDRRKVTYLPIEMFDGVCVSKELEELDKEWKTILNPPVLLDRLKINQAQQWVDNVEIQIVQTELRVTELDQERQAGSTLKGVTLYRYGVLRKQLSNRLTRLRAIHHRLLNRLEALLGW